MAKVVAFEIVINGVRQSITDVSQLDSTLQQLINTHKFLTKGTQLYADNERAISKLLVQKNKYLAAEQREQESLSKKAQKAAAANAYEKGSVIELKLRLAELTAQYNSLGKAQSSVSGRKMANEIKILTSEIQNQTKALKVHYTNLSDYRAGLNQLSTSLFSVFSGDQAGILKAGAGGFFNSIASATIGNLPVAAIQLAGSLANLAGEAVKFNAEVADSQADVAKNANLTVAQVQALSEELIRLDTRTTLEGLLNIGDALGKLGIEVTPQVIASMDKLNIALSDEFGNNPEKIATVVGKLKILFSEFNQSKPEDAYLKIGNALNKLAATGAATAPVMAEFSTRIAGTTGVYGLAASEILGVSATLEELGTTAYRGAGAFGRFIKQITSDTDNFSKTLGITPEVVQRFTGSLISFSDLVNKDVATAYKTVLGRINELNLSNTDLAAVYKQLHIVGVGEIEVVSKLATNYGHLTGRISDASKALGNADSIMQEFAKKNNSLAGEVAKLGNNLQEAFLSSSLANGLTKILSGVNSYFNTVKSAADSLTDEQIKINELGLAILDLNGKRDEQIRKISDLKTIYPEYFSQIDTEKAETALVLQEILKVTNNRDKQNAAIAKFKLEHPTYLKALQSDTSESAKLVLKILDLNTNNDERNSLITQLTNSYPSFFDKLKQELDLTNKLKSSLDEVNNAYSLRREITRSQELLFGDLPKRIKGLQNLVLEEKAFLRAFVTDITVKSPQLGLKPSQSIDERVAFLASLDRTQLKKAGASTKDIATFRGIVNNLATRQAELDKLQNEFKNKQLSFNNELENNYSSQIQRVDAIQKVLTNSVAEFEKEADVLEKARASKNFKQEADAKARLTTLSANVKTFLNEASVKALKDIENPQGRIAEVLSSLDEATNKIAAIEGRVKAASKSLQSPDSEAISVDTKKSKNPRPPSENPFLNAFAEAQRQEKDFNRKQQELRGKFDREADENKAKSIELSRKREKDLAQKVFDEKVSEIQSQYTKLELEQQQADEKFAKAIKAGQDYLSELKRKRLPDNEGIAAKVKELTDERAKYLEESAVKLEEVFKASGIAITELYAAFKQKKVEIDEKYDKALLKDLLDFTQTNLLEATNRLNEDFTDKLEKSAQQRLEKTQDILASNLNPRRKKAALLKADRESDAQEIRLRIDNYEQILNQELNRLGAFQQSTALNSKFPSIFPVVPQDEVEKQVKRVENVRRHLTAAKRQAAEKDVTIQRSLLAEEENGTKRIVQLRNTALELLDRYAQFELQIIRNNAEAAYNAKVEFLDREFAYKQRIYKDDADNLARIEKNRKEEQKRLDREYAIERQKIAIKEAEINTALSIIKVYATSPDPVSATIIAAGELILLREQIKAIRSQKFAEGGYTGKGFGFRDETGEQPVGVVHDGEYVMSKKMLRTRKGAILAQEAEKLRKGLGFSGNTTYLYADGGFVGQTPYLVNNTSVVVIDDSAVNLLASRVHDAVMQGSYRGTADGNEYANRLRERKSLSINKI